MAEIKQGTNEFYMEESGKVIARIEYTPGGQDGSGRELITITHTNVSEDHGGKGIGKQLVNRVAEYARDENKRINPQCSYAKHVLESSSQYEDVLSK